MKKKALASSEEKQKKNKLALCIVITIIFIVLLILLGLKSCSSEMPPPGPKIANDILTEGGLSIENRDVIDPNYFNIKINATPLVQNRKMNIRLENSPKNLYSCQIEVVINLQDKTETIYNSPKISPGQSLENCTLEKKLSPGNYKATAQYTIYDTQTDAVIGHTNVAINIAVN